MTDTLGDRILDDLARTEVHPDTQTYILDQADLYWRVLTTEAKMNAILLGDNVALRRHAETANRGFFYEAPPRSRHRELVYTGAGLAAGIGAPQFLLEVFSHNRNWWLLLICMALLIFGAMLFLFYFYGRELRRQ